MGTNCVKADIGCRGRTSNWWPSSALGKTNTGSPGGTRTRPLSPSRAAGDLLRCVLGQEPAGLPLPQAGVESALSDQLIVAALLDDAALVHDD